ncbi:MAG: hypothetical protein IPJ19_03480 [Planctomycetes bacterium]|nr:hypothetical protein [Planctomycetota bacterium]
MELNTELLRWILLVGAAPIWWPFLRTLWRDFDDTLADEGGVFGRPPGPREMERIRARRAQNPDPLVSEPWVRRDEAQPRKAQAAPPSRSPAGSQSRPRRRGFR